MEKMNKVMLACSNLGRRLGTTIYNNHTGTTTTLVVVLAVFVAVSVVVAIAIVPIVVIVVVIPIVPITVIAASGDTGAATPAITISYT